MRKIETIEDAREWIAAHDAKIDALWDEQRRFNEGTTRKFSDAFRRLSALEHRVMWLAGAAAAGGAVLGALIPRFFGG